MACFALCRQVHKVDCEFSEHILYGTTVLMVLVVLLVYEGGVQQAASTYTGTSTVLGSGISGRGY